MSSTSPRRVIRGSLIAVIAAGAMLLTTLVQPTGAYAVAPGAPSGLAPSGATLISNPALSWSAVGGAVRYNVQVDTTESFGSPDFGTVSTTNTRWVPASLPLKEGQVFWRVQAVNASNQASPWRGADFMVSPQAAPTPVSPGDGATLQQPNAAPLLSWTPVSGATTYTVEMDTDTDFVGATTLPATSVPYVVVPNPQSAGPTYYWHVRATRANSTVTEWSSTSSYTVSQLADPALQSPNDDSGKQIEDVVLDWGAVIGAKSYQLRVSTDQNFNTTIETRTGILSTRYSPPTTYLNNQYYWQVRAVDLAGNPSPWQDVSASWNFNRVWPERPTLRYPSDALSPPVGDPLFFQWSPVQHASTYQIDLGTDENFTPNSFRTCTTAETTYTPRFTASDSCSPGQGGVYFWRVRGMDAPANVPGIYSEIHSFVYESDRVTQTYPTNGATVSVPTLRWEPATDAQQYSVEIKNSAGSVVSTGTTYATQWTPRTSLNATQSPFTWSVRSIKGGPLSPKYAGWSFTLAGAPPTSSAAPLTPLTGTDQDPPTKRFPELTWEPKATASYYKVRIGASGSGFWLPSSTAPVLATELPYPTAIDTGGYFLRGGAYDWQVEAYDASDVLIGTGPRATFTIANLAAVTGQGVALNGQGILSGGCTRALATDSDNVCRDVPTTPVLAWDPVPDAGYYMVYLSEDRSFTNMVYAGTGEAGTANHVWTPNSPLPDSQAGQAYFWAIRPCRAPNIGCAPDPASTTDPATNAFAKRSPQVSFASTEAGPADAPLPVQSGSEVTFTWDDYLDTNLATTYSASGEASNQAARAYRIQVDDDPQFGSPIDDKTVDQHTYTAYDRTYPEGTLYWHVQALDASLNPLSWSPSRSFVKLSPSPALKSPTDGAHVSGGVPLRWTAQPFNASYEVEVYKNGDTALSPTNRIVQQTSKQVAWVRSQPFPASSLAYLWRVRRVDAFNNRGQWSAVRSFYSTGVAPTLLAPTGGAFVKASSALFSWAPAAGASYYKVEIRGIGATNNWVTVAKSYATAYAPTLTIPDGRWQWRVSAYDVANANDALGSSAWRDFKVDTTRPTVTSKTPTTLAYRSSNFVVHFSEPVTNVNTSTMKFYRAGRVTALSASVILSSDRRSATLNPAANLLAGHYYTVKVLGGIRDDAANGLVAMSWQVKSR